MKPGAFLTDEQVDKIYRTIRRHTRRITKENKALRSYIFNLTGTFTVLAALREAAMSNGRYVAEWSGADGQRYQARARNGTTVVQWRRWYVESRCWSSWSDGLSLDAMDCKAHLVDDDDLAGELRSRAQATLHAHR